MMLRVSVVNIVFLVLFVLTMLTAPSDSTMPQKFLKAYPHFTGPITPEESVKAVLAVVDKAKVDNEYAGGFVSHFGNKQWL